MGDDDTVFFPENLVAVLRKYDHEEMYYVGAPSESVEQNVMHSYGMAFGGGGFAVSRPAAAELARSMDGCLDRYRLFYGSDQRVQACLAELGVPLTREPGFHQVSTIFLRNSISVLHSMPGRIKNPLFDYRLGENASKTAVLVRFFLFLSNPQMFLETAWEQNRLILTELLLGPQVSYSSASPTFLLIDSHMSISRSSPLG
jgi:hypothetical protein